MLLGEQRQQRLAQAAAKPSLTEGRLWRLIRASMLQIARHDIGKKRFAPELRP